MMDLTTPTTAYQCLSPQEREVVDQYIGMVEIDAARRGDRVASYTGRPIPAELVRRSRGVLERQIVLAAINEQLMKVADNQDVSPRRVISENAVIAFSNIADFLRVGQFGELEIDVTRATHDQLRAVKSVKIVETPQGRRTEITLYDKQAALSALRELMDMPLIADYNQSAGQDAKIGDDAAKAYTNLLETMRPNT